MSPALRWSRRLLRVAGYVAFGVVCLVVSAYWTFPWERLALLAQAHAARQGWELTVGELGPSWLTGLRARQVLLVRPRAGPDAPPVRLHVDEVSARLSVLSLLGGDLGGSLEARLGDGLVQADVVSGSDRVIELEATIDRLPLRELPLRAMLPVPVQGLARGRIQVRYEADPANASGAIELTIEGLRVGDGRSRIPIEGMREGLTLDPVDAGTLELRARIEQGTVRIERLRAVGRDVRLQGAGSVRLGRTLRSTRLDVQARVAFEDAYRNRNDRTRGLFALLDLAPQARAARTPDGALQFRIVGSPATRVEVRPDGASRMAVDGAR
ncbi:MAG: type II secretion system protein GspN [Myxococcales bacterium]|nr:type II secretion system protein GspN [Myxococcales bacterium]